MSIVQKRLQLIEGVPASPLNTSQFSDSLIVSAPYTDEGIVHAVHFSSLLASELFMNGIWCRGAIVSGTMHHKGNVAFGQALIDAVEMESQLAVYPRILISEGVADKFITTKNAHLPKWRKVGTSAYFRRDFDHLLHLDIFSCKMFVPPKTGTIKDALKVVNRYVLERIDVAENLGVMKIQSKLFWISAYLRYAEELHGAWHFTVNNKTVAIEAQTLIAE